MKDLLQDIRFTWRDARKKPGTNAVGRSRHPLVEHRTARARHRHAGREAPAGRKLERDEPFAALHFE